MSPSTGWTVKNTCCRRARWQMLSRERHAAGKPQASAVIDLPAKQCGTFLDFDLHWSMLKGSETPVKHSRVQVT
jgi:hypothetical protein